ncbi:MAG: DUF6600 domain-containing protein, partial [Longimicrobiales bacterium]
VHSGWNMSPRITALFLAVAVSGAAFSDAADPPSRAGRLSYLQGEVVMQPESGAPADAELNRPLTLGDRLMTSSGSRAELSLGTAAIRLDESTDLLIANLDDDIAQIELNSGTLGIHVRELREAEIFEIDTPNAAVTLRRPGDYRIAVDPQGVTVLAVRTGEAELDGGRGAIRLGDRQELRFTGIEQSADVTALGPLNAFDEWSIERERAIADAESTRYVSRDVVGYEDLDRHGRWWSEPGYGHVWAPRVVIVGWAPYRFGHWTWISPWGWTWIDHASWGFAPFHFGRWAFIRHRWCWVPGPRHHRPVFAPAHVAWRGTPQEGGPGPVAVSWLPLGPREVHVPLHPASPRYLRNVNISNTIIDSNARITNVARNRVRNLRFANRDAPEAVTTMPRSAFVANRDRGVPTERRAAQSNSNRMPALRPERQVVETAGRAATLPRTRAERRVIESEVNRPRDHDNVVRFARRFDRPPARLRTEPRAILRAEPERRTPLQHAPKPQPRMLSQPSRMNADPHTNRSTRADGASRSRSSVQAHSSDQSQRAQSSRRSHSSMSRGQSARAGLRTNRR